MSRRVESADGAVLGDKYGPVFFAALPVVVTRLDALVKAEVVAVVESALVVEAEND
jgi:hypothetical protein